MKRLTAHQQVTDWLLANTPAAGWFDARDVVAAIEDLGYSKSTIYRAADRLGITTKQTGVAGADRRALWSRSAVDSK